MATQHSIRTFAPRIGNKASIFMRLKQVHDAWRQRRALARMDDAALADIGKTRTQALAEARRPLWDVPQHWRK